MQLTLNPSQEAPALVRMHKPVMTALPVAPPKYDFFVRDTHNNPGESTGVLFEHVLEQISL